MYKLTYWLEDDEGSFTNIYAEEHGDKIEATYSRGHDGKSVYSRTFAFPTSWHFELFFALVMREHLALKRNKSVEVKRVTGAKLVELYHSVFE